MRNNSIISVVILHPSELTERWRRYYCIDEIIPYISIEYWDCSAITIPSFKSTQRIESPWLRKITSKKDFKTRLSDLSTDTILVVDIQRNKNNYWIHKEISKYFSYTVFINFFSNEVYLPKGVDLSISKHWYSKYFRISTYVNFYNRRSRVTKFYSATNKSILRISCEEYSKYRINHPDYELYLDDCLQKESTTIRNRYLVYIDNYFPYHSEIRDNEHNFNPNKVAKGFYASLNSFFSRLEQKYSCEVIIAAHPASSYSCNPFNGRKLLFGKTNILVKNSIGVLLHTSAAISFAYLYNKPIMLLSNHFYRYAQKEQRRLEIISKRDNLIIHDTDDENTELVFLSRQQRDLYISKYLTDFHEGRNPERFIKYYKTLYNIFYCNK